MNNKPKRLSGVAQAILDARTYYRESPIFGLIDHPDMLRLKELWADYFAAASVAQGYVPPAVPAHAREVIALVHLGQGYQGAMQQPGADVATLADLAMGAFIDAGVGMGRMIQAVQHMPADMKKFEDDGELAEKGRNARLKLGDIKRAAARDYMREHPGVSLNECANGLLRTGKVHGDASALRNVIKPLFDRLPNGRYVYREVGVSA